jgi:hypothetical protein
LGTEIVMVALRYDEDAPLTDVTAQPVGGWTPEVVHNGIVWSGGSIADEDRADFTFTGTLPPDTDTVEFRVLQTYDSGEVDRWIEPADTDGSEPEFPAPVLEITPGTAAPTTSSSTAPPTTADDSENSATTSGQETSSTVESEATAPNAPTIEGDAEDSEGDDDSSGPIVGIVIAILVIAAAVAAFLVSRRNRARRELGR